MAKAPQKSKEAKAKAATGSSKKSKKKWSKGKSRDKLQNLCLFDKPTYDRLMKEVPKYKVNDFSWPTFIFWPFLLHKMCHFPSKMSRINSQHTFKVITPSIVSDRMKIRGSLARRAIKQLHQEGKIKLEIQVRIEPCHFDWSLYTWLNLC